MDGCKGYLYNTPDGREYDCEYEFAGNISCEDCKYGPYPDENSLDPSINYEEEV